MIYWCTTVLCRLSSNVNIKRCFQWWESLNNHHQTYKWWRDSIKIIPTHIQTIIYIKATYILYYNSQQRLNIKKEFSPIGWTTFSFFLLILYINIYILFFILFINSDLMYLIYFYNFKRSSDISKHKIWWLIKI